MGKTPYPAMVDRPLPDKFGAGMSWGDRWPAVASWWHSMYGWLWSTDGYFRLWSTQACTDYGIGGAGDGAYDGVVFRWIDAATRRFAVPWASGWSDHPDFDDQGRAFYTRFGNRGINEGGRAIEFSGLDVTPVTVKQWAAGIQLTAAIHSQEIGQSWEEFAWNMQHYEVAEKSCPYPRIIEHTAEYQAAIVLTMKHFETGADIPEFATINGLRVPLAGGKDAGPITPAPDKPIMIAFAKPRYVHTRPGALSRQWAYTGAQKVRQYPAGTRLRVVGYYHGEAVGGDDRWLVIASPGPSNNARIHVSGIKELIADPGLVAG